MIRFLSPCSYQAYGKEGGVLIPLVIMIVWWLKNHNDIREYRIHNSVVITVIWVWVWKLACFCSDVYNDGLLHMYRKMKFEKREKSSEEKGKREKGMISMSMVC